MKTLSVADVRAAVDREWGRFIAALPPAADTDAWGAPTRCAGWSVADLAIHAVWGVSMEADALRRARTGVADPAEGHQLDAAVVGPEVILAELIGSRRALLDELAAVDNDADRIVPLPYGNLPLALFLPILAMEAGVHADDLAAALGRPSAPGDLAVGVSTDEPLADDVVVGTTNFLVTFLPLLAAAAPETPPEGTVVAVRGATVDLRLSFTGGQWSAADANDLIALGDASAAGGPSAVGDPAAIIGAEDDSTVLRFALGRLPADDPRLVLSGSPRLGHAFKRWFPGP